MKPAGIIGVSLNALADRKIRTGLTILMVIVGSSLMVALNGIVAGLGEFVQGIFDKLAPNILFVSSFPQAPSSEDDEEESNGQSGGNQDSSQQGPPSFLGQGIVPTPKITLDDTVAEKLSKIEHVSDVIPTYQGRITLASGNYSQDVSVLSIQPQNLKTIAPALELAEGSIIDPDNKSAILIPMDIAVNLKIIDENKIQAPITDIIGKSVNVTYSFIDIKTASRQLNSENYKISGIINPVGNPTIDRAVVFNLESGNELMKKDGKFDALFVIASNTEKVEDVEKSVKEIYGDDIGITTSKAILKSIQDFTSGFGTFISSIALVALVVGSVGIVTTMYTSVTERVKEIGVMKALGARNLDVMGFFLIEALIIGIIGASTGLVVGITGGYTILFIFATTVSEVTPSYTPADLMYVWFISVGLSIAAGLYPSWKASRLSPIVSLRRE